MMSLIPRSMQPMRLSPGRLHKSAARLPLRLPPQIGWKCTSCPRINRQGCQRRAKRRHMHVCTTRRCSAHNTLPRMALPCGQAQLLSGCRHHPRCALILEVDMHSAQHMARIRRGSRSALACCFQLLVSFICTFSVKVRHNLTNTILLCVAHGRLLVSEMPTLFSYIYTYCCASRCSSAAGGAMLSNVGATVASLLRAFICTHAWTR